MPSNDQMIFTENTRRFFLSISGANSITCTQKIIIDSFLAISRVSLASAERLPLPGTAVVREAFSGGAAGVRTVASVTSVSDIDVMAPMIYRSFSYARSVQEIAAESRDEVTQLMQTQFSSPNHEMPDLWRSILVMFAKPAQKKGLRLCAKD